MTRCVASLCLLVAVTTLSRFCVHGFVVPSTFSVPSVGSRSNHVCMSCPAESNEPKLGGSSNVATFSTRKPSPSIVNPIGAVCTSSVFWIATSQMAMADSPDWGIFEGRTGSLLHPITMGSLFVFSLYTAYLGFQWRRQRTLGDEISDLRKTLPNLEGAPSVSAALSAAKDANDLYKINALTAALAIEDKIVSLTAERKSLAEAGLRDKHFQQGAMLAFIGTCFAIEVCVVLCAMYSWESLSWRLSLYLMFTLFDSNVNLGPTEYICSCRKVIPWSSFICRCRFGMFMGISSSMCSCDAKGE